MEGKRKLGCAGLVVSVLAMLFCFMGVVQAIWLSATPNYPLERARFNVWLWGAGTLLSFAMLCVFAFILYRTRGKRFK